MEIITREAADLQFKSRFYTGKPCKKGHLAERYVTNGGCVMCVNKVRRVGLGDGMAAFTPRIPLRVPVYFGEPQLEQLRITVQTFMDETVARWQAQWDAARDNAPTDPA